MTQDLRISPELGKSLKHERLDEETTRCLVLRAQGGDRAAMDEILIHNERLIYSIALKYIGSAGDNSLDDLMQEGRMGMFRAIQKFDLERKVNGRAVKFSTYAAWWVQQRIRRYGTRAGQQIGMSYKLNEMRSRGTQSRATLMESEEREPTSTEIATHAGIKQVAADSLGIRFFSLDAEGVDYEDDEALKDQGVNLDREIDQRDLIARVEKNLAYILPQYQKIIRLFYGLEDGIPRSLDEIATELRVTKRAVLMGRHKALAYLRSRMQETSFDEYAGKA